MEPGLWEGDEPRASRSGPQAEPVLLGVTLPGLPLSDTKTDVGPARACVALWNEALPGTGLAEKVNELRLAEKQCMVALVFHTCARIIEQIEDNTSEDGVVVLLARLKREQLRESAENFRRAACKGVPETAAQRRLLDRLRATLRRSLKTE